MTRTQNRGKANQLVDVMLVGEQLDQLAAEILRIREEHNI